MKSQKRVVGGGGEQRDSNNCKVFNRACAEVKPVYVVLQVSRSDKIHSICLYVYTDNFMHRLS